MVLVTVTRRVMLGAQQQFFGFEYLPPGRHVSATIQFVGTNLFVVVDRLVLVDLVLRVVEVFVVVDVASAMVKLEFSGISTYPS